MLYLEYKVDLYCTDMTGKLINDESYEHKNVFHSNNHILFCGGDSYYAFEKNAELESKLRAGRLLNSGFPPRANCTTDSLVRFIES